MKTIALTVGACAMLFAFLLPPPGHGDYFNPLRISPEPLEVKKHQEYTDRFMAGNITLKGMGAPKLITKWSEIEIAPPEWGWGNDQRNAINFYKLSDELYDKVCPDFAEAKRLVYEQESIEVVEHVTPWGPHPIGCGKLPRKFVNVKRDGLSEVGSLYFNSLFYTPEDFERLLGDTTTLFVSTFFSEFPSTRHTSPFHIAISPSLAVQCHGSKMWNFVPPRALGKYGGRSFNGAAMLRGVDEDEPQIVVKTTKGTVLTFPPWWAHNVYSYGGPSFMYTLRKSYGGSIILNLFKRAFRERLSLWFALPPWNGKTAYENTKDGTDIHGIDCPNDLTENELKTMLKMDEAIAGWE